MKLRIGQSLESQRQLFINYGERTEINNHAVFYGKSGMGKSYAINLISRQCVELGYACVILDYSQSYNLCDDADGKIHVIDVDDYQIGAFRVKNINGNRENPYKYASRVSSILQKMFKFGEVQKEFAFEVAQRACEQGKNLTLMKLAKADQVREKSEQLKIYRKIINWAKAPCFAENRKFIRWKEIISSEATYIIKFSCTYSESEKIFLSELILLDLLAYCEERGPIDNLDDIAARKESFILCLDEVQRLSFSKQMPLRRLLTEGRKFGANIWASTQSVELCNKDMQILLGQAEVIFEFHPDDRALLKYKKEKDERRMMLKKLGRGQCMITARYVRNDGKVTRKASLYAKIQ